MKTLKTLLKSTLIGLLSLAATSLVATARVQAIPYDGTNTQASPVPAFNVFTGAPAPDSNEADFFTARVPANGNDQDSSTPFVDPLNASCVNGQRINMRVYVHNGASEEGNNGGSGPSVAHDVKVRVDLKNAAPASTFSPTATISASNTTPTSVTDGLTVNCNGKIVRLNYVNNSATSWSKGTGVVDLDDNALLTTGAPIRSQDVAGDVWGCWDDRVYVVFSVTVEEIPDEPEEPVFVCDLLRITRLGERRYRFSVDYTADNGATFKSALFNFGNGDTRTSTDPTNPSVEYRYPRAGTFDSFVILTFTVDGDDVTAPGTDGCAKQVTAEKDNCPIPGKQHLPNDPAKGCKEEPETPPELPKTGAGSLVGLFSATSVAGAVAHRFVSKRRRA